jgi:hypothetical protein
MGNIIRPTHDAVYTAHFRPGRYTYVKNSSLPNGGGTEWWLVLRDGVQFGFAFTEDAAAQMCFALEITLAHLTGNSALIGQMIAAFKAAAQ